MADLIYRVVSACSVLGYGFPGESLREAIKGRVDAIVADAGSIDAGPYYLGAGATYFDREAVKADYRHMVAAGLATCSPVILGSCGMAGGDRNLDWMLELAREVFTELDVREAKVAVIRAQLDPDMVIEEFRAGRLCGTGAVPSLSEASLRESTIVAQMGVHPIITALESGATFIFAGRSCDVALFAADMLRRGIDAGLAYHVGHILECGAFACDPGSPSDCLVAEIYHDGSAAFVAPELDRLCTPYSIAAHALYEVSHPQLQFYPEGILSLTQTEYFARGSRSAVIRKSTFVRAHDPSPQSVKLEGARWTGKRRVSLIHIDRDSGASLPPDALVYGRNGVELSHVQGGERELGLIIQTTASTPDAAVFLARLVTGYLLHYDYPGRKTTAGNIAFPLSPNVISFEREDGAFGAVVIGGTREPLFIAQYPQIKAAVERLVSNNYPQVLANAQYRIAEASENAPVALVRTVERDPEQLAQRHRAQIAQILGSVPALDSSLMDLDGGDAYEWSLYHLLKNVNLIKEQLFPITYYAAQGTSWRQVGDERPRYAEVGIPHSNECIDDRCLSAIEDAPTSWESPYGGETLSLSDMTTVIRSKNVGVNRLTFDIVFNSSANYEASLRSNLFFKDNVADILGIARGHVIGSYFVDSCYAIKISIERSILAASAEERDVFGAQQQARLARMRIPLFRSSLAKGSTL